MRTRSGSVLPWLHERSVSGVPWYRPSSVSGGSISMSSRRSADGSSSTTITMFRIALRKRCGMDASASATWRSNSARSTGLFARSAHALVSPTLARSPSGGGLAQYDGLIEVAVVADGADVAHRFGAADAPPVED